MNSRRIATANVIASTKTTNPPRAWVGVVSQRHVLRGSAEGFAQLGHGKRAPLERISAGDWLVYYSPRTDLEGGAPLRAFTAIGRLEGERTYQVDMGGGFTPFRRDVAYETIRGPAPIDALGPELSFIRENPNWGMLARRGHFEISVDDLRRIAEALGVSIPRERLAD